MKEISAAIHEGARAFLFSEYKILIIFIAVVFIALGFAIGWDYRTVFPDRGCFSILAGFFGMSVATRANVRTANAAGKKACRQRFPLRSAAGRLWVSAWLVLVFWASA